MGGHGSSLPRPVMERGLRPGQCVPDGRAVPALDQVPSHRGYVGLPVGQPLALVLNSGPAGSIAFLPDGPSESRT